MRRWNWTALVIPTVVGWNAPSYPITGTYNGEDVEDVKDQIRRSMVLMYPRDTVVIGDVIEL